MTSIDLATALANESDAPVRWFRYVRHSQVETYSLLGWQVTETTKCHHDLYSVMMLYEGDAQGEPPMPAGSARPMRRRVKSAGLRYS